MRDGPSPKLGIAVGLSMSVFVWAVLWLGGSRYEGALETGCQGLIEGDSLESVVATLGLDGYRPGCRIAATDSAMAARSPDEPTTACTIGTFGALRDFPYRCDGDDCSLYWRVRGVGCLVELSPGAMTVESSTFLTLGAQEDSPE